MSDRKQRATQKTQNLVKRDIPSAEIPIKIYFWKDIGSFYCYRDEKTIRQDENDCAWFGKYLIQSVSEVPKYYDLVWEDSFETKEMSLIFSLEAIAETIYRKVLADRTLKVLPNKQTGWVRDILLDGDIIVINDMHYFIITQPCPSSPSGLKRVPYAT
jgi:hypothetical protein